MAVKVSFELGDATKRAVLDQLGESHKVGIPAAIYGSLCQYGLFIDRELEHTLEHSKLLVVLLRNSDELVGFLCGGGEGLLADD